MLNHIGDIVDSLGVKEGVFLDIFAGTNNVAKFFKQKGFKVITNDINECSTIFAKATIENDHVPSFSKIVEKYDLRTICTDALIEKYFLLNSNGHKYSWADFKVTEKNLVYVLTFLSFIDRFKSLIIKEKHFDFFPLVFRNYCPGGSKSSYRNQAGTISKRMFFTDTHGKQIDLVLNTLKFWKQEELISIGEFNILASALVHAATLFSNTSGVYEAFYKKWFPNTQQTFRLPVPDLVTLRKPKGKSYCMDAANFVHHFKKPVDVLYIDPPYNTRQYDSNYHLLNTLAKFDRIEDLKSFEKKLVGARGQNMELVYKSPFSSRKTFIGAMEDLVKNVDAKHVLVSYFDGDDNLWNESGNKTGIKVITTILKNKELFKPETFKIIKIPRQNFQSRNGQTKEIVNELIFCVEKR
ncbi:MAG: DNA adenine methylase [Chlamydiales bacterium]|nr:DNA adenine methylase [Chlamydiales bacterium]